MKLTLLLLLSLLIYSCSNASDQQKLQRPSSQNDSLMQPAPASIAPADKANEFQLTDSVKMELIHDIDLLVKAGFYDKNTVVQSIDEMYAEYNCDKKWLTKAVAKSFSAQSKEASTWKKETDFDRLEKAFKELNAAGFISLHNAADCRTDAIDECESVNETLQKNKVAARGYCYYHEQDVAAAVEGNGLYIGFDNFKNSAMSPLEVGKKIMAVLKATGFLVEWNENIDTRIFIRNFNWQKRPGQHYTTKEDIIQLFLSKKK